MLEEFSACRRKKRSKGYLILTEPCRCLGVLDIKMFSLGFDIGLYAKNVSVSADCILAFSFHIGFMYLRAYSILPHLESENVVFFYIP